MDLGGESEARYTIAVNQHSQTKVAAARDEGADEPDPLFFEELSWTLGATRRRTCGAGSGSRPSVRLEFTKRRRSRRLYRRRLDIIPTGYRQQRN